jgi:agmatine/peptidylarginine deiminase
MELKAGDIWIRDWAPLLCERNGKTVAVKFQYPDTYAYAAVTSNKAGTKLANRLGIELIDGKLVWELGNFTTDGKHIIVTDQVLNANVLRNEDELRDVLVRGLDFDPTIEIYCLELDILNGALWSLFGHKLEHSICHIDGYMRFLDEQRVICQIPDVSNAYDQLTLHQKINSNPKWLKLASQYLAINKEIAARIRQLGDQLRSDGLKVFEINSPVSPDDVDALMAGADTLPDSV